MILACGLCGGVGEVAAAGFLAFLLAKGWNWITSFRYKRKLEGYCDTRKGEPCPVCESPLEKRRNRLTGLPFIGCSIYPVCHYTSPRK